MLLNDPNLLLYLASNEGSNGMTSHLASHFVCSYKMMVDANSNALLV